MKNRKSIFWTCIAAAYLLIAVGIFFLTGASSAWDSSDSIKVKPHPPRSGNSLPQVPSFAMRAKIPASGKQGPPAKAATLRGDGKKGEGLYVRDCQSCHGRQGTDHVSNPGSADGTVPPLNPIDPALAHKNPSVFAANIDRFIQHGSIPEGSRPLLIMPNWGDSKQLSQKDIAHLEAYIMRLNGVARKKP